MNRRLDRLMGRATCALLATLIFFGEWGSTHAAEAPANNTLTAEELAAGWILLFDGATDFGWQAANKANWKVAEGVISVSEGEPGLLCTTSEFGNYRLKLEFRSDVKTNSGVFLRTARVPKDPKSDCYELNIAAPDVSPFPTGSFVGREKAPGTGDPTKWRQFDVTADGGRFVIKLDGETVLDYTDAKPIARGPIGLQLNSGRVEFRNIKLLPLGLKPMFSGKDMAGWKVFDGDAAKAKATWKVDPADGVLSVEGGPGQLETEGRYADFTLQAQIKTGGVGLNSGIFFRSIPGQYQNGYESQIQNAYKDGDRNVPADFGTGAFYRRQKARRVVADDEVWFYETLIVSGAHMASWVNGIQVCDWTDERPAHENPRQGLRTEAGTIILQAHDPTTKYWFRDFKIAEMPAR